MKYPGQRVQIDVKFVPQACIVGQQEPTQRKGPAAELRNSAAGPSV